MIVSIYLVIGPIISDPQMAYFYALIFILAGLIFYIPFVYYKKVFPGMGKKIQPISSEINYNLIKIIYFHLEKI